MPDASVISRRAKARRNAGQVGLRAEPRRAAADLAIGPCASTVKKNRRTMSISGKLVRRSDEVPKRPASQLRGIN